MTGTREYTVQRWDGDGFSFEAEVLADERLIHIILNDQRITTLLGSDNHVLELSRGHLATEYEFDLSVSEHEISVDADERETFVRIAAPSAPQLAVRPNIVTSSCGACNQDHYDVAITPYLDFQIIQEPVDQEIILAQLLELKNHQHAFKRTGGTHAAGLLYADGTVLVREDIGRHNAVDKVIGSHLCNTENPSVIAMLLSGRCGWDIVVKAARCGIPIIASIGAASSFAADTARSNNMTLLTFVRNNRAVVIGPVEGRLKGKD